MNHIELFAGCGGLSLGLESSGFKMLLANELSPMAAETFAYNFFGQDLAADAKSSEPARDNLKVKWLSSNFDRSRLANRLREDPRTFPTNKTNNNSDISTAADLKGNLVIGSIIRLNEWLAENDEALGELARGFDGSGVDLVSGGPPCQSFSMAGMREFSNSRNVLPWEFARFVEMVKPRFALLENVTGILRPFKVEGQKIYAWFEVAKAFAEVGYVPLCLHINAKYAGVAQNRPRFLMMLFRQDTYEQLLPGFNASEQSLMESSGEFYAKVRAKDIKVAYGDLDCHDPKVATTATKFEDSFLKHLIQFRSKPVSVMDAIDDLYKKKRSQSPYLKRLAGELAPCIKPHPMENHDLRANSPRVTRRFRVYQVLQACPREVQNEVRAVLNGSTIILSRECWEELKGFDFLMEDGSTGRFQSKQTLTQFLIAHQTKKQTQKALNPASPAPAALSIPDDACHYKELRTLSVREMARIQSFPDNFTFRSKVTTGGQMRKFEVPQYTQVGNAVPPLLGRAIGHVFKDLHSRVALTGVSGSAMEAITHPKMPAVKSPGRNTKAVEPQEA